MLSILCARLLLLPFQSGLAMHPVEHTFYFSCALLPLVFKLHPVLFLFNLLHAAISPMAGHDGLSGEVGGGEFISILISHS